MYPDARYPDQEHRMKLCLAAVATAAVAFVAPAAAAAATLTVTNPKPCFGSDDRVTFRGTGFTPGGIVDFTRDGESINPDPPLTALADGSVNARLKVFNERGVDERSYAATDRTNPALTAAAPVAVSELDVDMRPRSGEPSEARRIAAVGFTRGTTLWAHIVFKGRARTVKVGALSGACGNLSKRKRLFGADPPFGRHLIHFDTSRRFRRARPAQRVSFSFRIFPTSNSGAATASTAARR
jgi:hypothetical protein